MKSRDASRVGLDCPDAVPALPHGKMAGRSPGNDVLVDRGDAGHALERDFLPEEPALPLEDLAGAGPEVHVVLAACAEIILVKPPGVQDGLHGSDASEDCGLGLPVVNGNAVVLVHPDRDEELAAGGEVELTDADLMNANQDHLILHGMGGPNIDLRHESNLPRSDESHALGLVVNCQGGDLVSVVVGELLRLLRVPAEAGELDADGTRGVYDTITCLGVEDVLPRFPAVEAMDPV